MTYANSSPMFTNSGTMILDSNIIASLEIEFRNEGSLSGIGTFDFPNQNLEGSGTINPGLSPGILKVDGDLVLQGGIVFELEDNSGPGIGHDLLIVKDHIEINDAFCQLSGMMNISDGIYKILECENGAGCYTGTFDTSYLSSDLRLDFLPDRINLVKGPACINTWKVDALYLTNDPHINFFQTYNRIISNGAITSPEDITFSAPGSIELEAGFEVGLNAVFSVLLIACEE